MGLVQSKQGASATSPLTITLDSSTGAGNGLVVMVTASGTTLNGHVSGITLGGAAGNFAQVATIGATTDASITASWLDLNCAGGQTSVAITFTGGTGTQQFFAAVYERDDLLTASAFDKTASNTSTIAWTSGATATLSQANEVIVGAVFISGSSQPTITGPSSPWANLTTQTATQGAFLVAWQSGWEAVSSTAAVTYAGTSTNGTDGTALVVTLKQATAAAAASVLPSLIPPGRMSPMAFQFIPQSFPSYQVSSVVNQLTLSATVNATDVLQNTTGKILTETALVTATLTRNQGKILTGLVNVASTVVRSAGKPFTGSVFATGSLTAFRQLPRSFAAAVNVPGSLTRVLGKPLPALVNAAGTLTRGLGKTMTGLVNATGSLTLVKVKIVVLAALVNVTGTVTRTAGKIVASLVNAVASSHVSIGRILSGTVNVTGSAVRSASKSLSGVVNAAGSLTDVKARLLTLAASVFTTGSQRVSLGKTMTGAAGIAGASITRTGKVLSGLTNVSGTVIRSVRKTLAGLVNVQGVLSFLRVRLLALSGSVNITARYQGNLGKVLLASAAVPGVLVRRIGRLLSAVVPVTGVAVRGRVLLLVTTARATGSLVAVVLHPVLEFIVFRFGVLTRRWVTGNSRKRWRVP